MITLKLALRSVWNRRSMAALTVLAVALSVSMLLGVEKLRRDARSAFTNTISDTDLIVGARSGAVQLLLYSVFRIGNATNNITWESYLDIVDMPRVSWAVPISLGDSHRGFRVMGTTLEYFDRYRYASDQSLRFAAGRAFDGVFDVVLGAQVAADLGYQLGDDIVVAHGTGEVSLTLHDDKPFQVVGILEPTGTPVDRTVHVSLQGIEAIHVDWQAGAPVPGYSVSAEEALTMNLEPKNITAVLVGLESRLGIFRVQRQINEYREEPLLAIIPGVALQELWDLVGVAEQALRVISIMVVVTGLLGMLTVILSSLEARRREMAVLRSVGARPSHIFGLFTFEAGLLAVAGICTGICLFYGVLLAGRPFVASEVGLHIPLSGLNISDIVILASIVLAALLVGCVPALRAYRLSVADGLSMRI